MWNGVLDKAAVFLSCVRQDKDPQWKGLPIHLHLPLTCASVTSALCVAGAFSLASDVWVGVSVLWLVRLMKCIHLLPLSEMKETSLSSRLTRCNPILVIHSCNTFNRRKDSQVKYGGRRLDWFFLAKVKMCCERFYFIFISLYSLVKPSIIITFLTN